MSNRKSQARTKVDSEQKDENIFVSQHSRKPNVVGRVLCLLGFHKWGGEDFNICQRCKKKAVGLPKFENPPPCPPPMNQSCLNSLVEAAEVEEDCEKSGECSP